MSVVYVKNICTLDDELTGNGGGTPRVGLEIEVRIMPNPVWVNNGTVEKNKRSIVYTNSTGLWQIGLQPNSEITIPTGSYGTVKEGRDGTVKSFVVPIQSDSRVTLNVDTGHYEVWLESILEATPSNTTPIQAGISEAELTAEITRATAAETLIQGRNELVLYDDFSTYANGSPAGHAPEIGPSGAVWATTGANPPLVTSGVVSAPGTGYLNIVLPEKPKAIIVGISFTGDPTVAVMTMGTSKDTPLLTVQNIAPHFNWSATGFNVSLRQDGEANFAANNSFCYGSWTRPMATDGTVYPVMVCINGTTVIVIGPSGETFSSDDAAVGYLSGPNIFFEPTTNTSPAASAKVHWVAAIAQVNTGELAAFLHPGDVAARFDSDAYGRAVGSRNTSSEVSIGRDAVTAQAGITFGTSGGSQILATLQPGTYNVGATSISSDQYIPTGSSLRVDLGNNVETVTTTGVSAVGTSPYTITVPPLAKAHTAGIRMAATPAASWMAKIAMIAAGWLQFTGLMQFGSGNGAVIIGTGPGVGIFFGSGFDTLASRDSSGVLAISGSGTGLGGLKVGQCTTATRPSATTVGNGLLLYDTTIGAHIWSVGGVWIVVDGQAGQVYDVFTGKSTGALGNADSGQTYTKVDAGGAGDGLSIISGKLSNTASHSGAAAGYAQILLSANVRRIGCKFVFAAGTTTGALNLAIWKTSLAASFPTIPDSPLHLTFTPATYGISTWTSGSPTTLVAAQTWRAPLTQDGATQYEIEVVIDDSNNIYVYRPDGIVDGPFTSAAVGTNAGSYADWEVFQNAANTEAKGSFIEVWADVKGVY